MDAKEDKVTIVCLAKIGDLLFLVHHFSGTVDWELLVILECQLFGFGPSVRACFIFTFVGHSAKK